jgi:Domain of unknown function (DUF1996)
MKPIVSRPSSHLALALLSGLTLGACVGEVEDGTSDDIEYSVAGELSWTQCAKQGQYCSFTGKRFVRFGAGSRWVTASFANGVLCSNRSFKARLGTGNSCQIMAADTADTADAGHAGMNMGDAGMDMGDAGMNMGDAGMDMGSGSTGMNMGDAGMNMGSGSTGMNMGDAGMNMGSGSTGTTDMTGMTGMGPTIDMTKIPVGNPGVGVVQLQPTGEQPGPSDGTGAFRTRCEYSHMLKDDPIVYPGRAGASHLHTFFGNKGANASSTHDSLRASGNSTCRGGIANRTAYWVPSVIDEKGVPLKPTFADFYYKTGYNGINPASIKPFPAGLRMIAGDAKASSAQPHAYWGCHNNYVGHPSTIPNCPAGDDVVMYVVFPQCWDGVNLDSADHKSHMAYPQNGACPSTHPVAIPEIMFNIYYPQPAGSTSGWRLSSDMYASSIAGGYSAHADYMEGWDPEIVKTFVTNCDNRAVDCHSHLLGDGRMMYNSAE